MQRERRSESEKMSWDHKYVFKGKNVNGQLIFP
jgi:hypothetical protein